MLINRFREWVNLQLYDSKITVLRIFDFLKLICAFVAIGLLLYTVGYALTDEDRIFHITLLEYILSFFIINYFIRFLYTFEPGKFLRQTAFELFLIVIVLIQIGSLLFSDSSILAHLYEQVFSAENSLRSVLITMQVILILILVLDFAKIGGLVTYLKIDTIWIFIMSFLVMIGIGTVLLMMPEMSYIPNGASLLEALFTSTSASCVTGLIVVDTATFWTVKGQIVIMILIQIGGVSILTFATFFAVFFAKGVGAKQQSVLRDFFSTESMSDAKHILSGIIYLSIIIEIIGAILIYFSFDPSLQFPSNKNKIYYAIFHSVSAFNNSGFCIFSDGLYNSNLRNSYLLHYVIIGLVFLGAIGFPTLQEFFSLRKIRERRRFKWKKMSIGSRISLGTTMGLILFTAILTYLLERNHFLVNESAFSTFSRVIFQAVDRTAGFNTMDTGELRTPTLILFCMMMFIGSSSASVGGGIRTSTFAVLFLSGFAILRGKPRVEVFNQTIPQDLIAKSFSLLLFTAVFEVIMFFLLTITDPQFELMDIIFEVCSAIATMGRSTGITAELSDTGKYLITLCMFIGRIGTITLIAALSEKAASSRYKYPPAQFMVG